MIIGVGYSEINEFLVSDVAIQTQTNTSDGGGGYVTTWTTNSTVKGLEVELNGNEIDLFSKKKIEVNSKVYLKKGSIVTVNDRLVISDKSYSIKEVKNPMNANEFIICYCGSK